MLKLSNAEIAYVSGVFEGEGCISIEHRTGRTDQVRLHVAMTDLDVLQKLQRLTRMGTIISCTPRPRTKPSWRWSVSTREDTADLLKAMIPWLSFRRTMRAVEALDVLEVDNSGNRHSARDPRTGHFVTREGTNALVEGGQPTNYAATPFGSDAVNPY